MAVVPEGLDQRGGGGPVGAEAALASRRPDL